MIAMRAAPEIDRLVFAVHRHARHLVASDLPAALEAAGMESPGALNNVGELVRAGRLTREAAALRYRYWPIEERDGFLDESVAAGRLIESNGRLTGSDAVMALIDVLEGARAAAAAALWAGHRPEVEELTGMCADVLAASGKSPLLDAFAAVPLPEPAEHRLFALFERLRYLRNDAHAAAWTSAGLTAADMVELTPIWNGKDPRGDVAALASLEERGLVSGGRLTEVGRSIREAIEDDTNRRAQPAFDVLGDRAGRFLELLEALPDEA